MRYNSLGRSGKIDFEQEILTLYDKNETIKSICSELDIGKSTVHNYLKKNNRRRHRAHSFDAKSFSVFTPESCYWAGFIAADGCISKIKTHIRVELNIKDSGHLYKLLKFVNDKDCYVNTGSKTSTFKSGKVCNVEYCRADVNSVDIVKDLGSNFNIHSAKSFTLCPPENIPDDLIVHYIRGYFDGDGSIYWNKSHKCGIFNISSGSAKLLSWISDNMRDNVNYNFAKRAFAVRKNKSIFYISQPHSSAQAIFDWLYRDSTSETRLDRKYERYLEYYN